MVDNKVLQEEEIEIGKGTSRLVWGLSAEKTGLHTYKVEVIGAQDSRKENNLGQSITQVEGFNIDKGSIYQTYQELDPGNKVYGVDYEFLAKFYQFDENRSIAIGNLIGYERGENIVPVFLDVNKLVTEHLAVLAMTGSGKSYTVGRIIERLVAQMNGTVVVFDTHGEYGKAFEKGVLRFNNDIEYIEDTKEQESIIFIQERFRALQEAGGGIHVYTLQMDEFDYKYVGKNKHLALQFDRFEMDDFEEILPGHPSAIH